MLKAGEYSPNNPLIRAERPAGGALLGLGEYERRRNTLRKLRQQQYREYLDQQAKKKQDEKEEAERQRREREQREKERDEEERERQRIERERASPERPRAYTNTVFNPQSFISKVDTGVQTMSTSSALSVAVQTDDAELYRLPLSALPRTQAERELSPRTVLDARPHRRSCGDLQPEESLVTKRRQSDSRHYKTSLLDADAITLRNEQAEQEATAKRQCYQQELRDQIQEQRRARERMLEQAEMRRLEEQLRMLRVAQETEVHKHGHLADQMKENATDYEKKRTALQKEINLEQQALRAPKPAARHTHTSRSALPPTQLYYPPIHGRNNTFTQSERKPFSTNIPDNSIFNPNYDVDSYLRKNLNPSKDILLSNRLDTASSELSLRSKYLHRLESNDRKVFSQAGYEDKKSVYSPIDRFNDVKTDTINLNKVASVSNINDKATDVDKRVVIEKALIHDRPREKYEPSTRNTLDNPIPVLRHSPVVVRNVENKELSEAMQVVDDKWKVPAVQKNILKSLPNEDGKNVNILTQLGSIRRQLQLEQLKLDGLVTKDDL